MGIYGALATAVSGMRAQSFALEHISGNIANSQTAGYKRIETDFVDLIPEAPVKRQVPGAVVAQARGTNDVSGDIKAASSETFMALNGDGFFVVDQKVGENDGYSVFGGTNYYTRRGDFTIDKDGYLVNGAGYFLKGLKIDQTTKNVSGSVPEVVRIPSDFLPAKRTERVDYTLNLPQAPKNAAYRPGVVGSELMVLSDYNPAIPAPRTATATGAAIPDGTAAASTLMADGESLTIDIGGTPYVFDFHNGGVYGGANIGIDVAAGISIDTALADIQAELRAASGIATATVSRVGTPAGLQISLNQTTPTPMTITDGTTGLGIANATYPYRPAAHFDIATIDANHNDLFLRQSIAGGAITVFADNGSPVNVQMRWAKSDSAETGGAETWNLYYMSDSTAVGTETKWRQVGGDYTFAANGALTPAIASTTISNLTVDGVTVGNVELSHGTNGVTQFADPNGTSQVTALAQNGYAAGEYISVTVNSNGRIVASYSNNQQVELAQVVTANFNAPNQLKRLDGGIFVATSGSGEAIISSDGGSGILGASLEASNTDISEEFTKLIVTQQAYAAGTRIVSTSDEMLQEALNMVR